MINKTQVSVFAVAVLLSGPLAAQQMSASWDMFVFPSGGQDVDVQAVDERACLQWGQEVTGVDPFNPGAGVQARAPAQSSGGAAQGAVRGALRGALIGEITDEDASDFALAGAMAGTVRGARRQEQQNQQARAQAQADAQAQTRARLESFRKAFSACMQGKNYTVTM